MKKIFTEENHFYQIDCSKALWASDAWHTEKTKACGRLRDVDWIMESKSFLYLIEYKNSCVPCAKKPENFKPTEEPIFSKLIEKYFDSLHFINVMGLSKPRKYVCVLEYPAGDAISRKLLRNRLKGKLFYLQRQPYAKTSIIADVDVVNIAEWNKHPEYNKFKITPIAASTASAI